MNIWVSSCLLQHLSRPGWCVCLGKSLRSTRVASKYSISFGSPHQKWIQQVPTHIHQWLGAPRQWWPKKRTLKKIMFSNYSQIPFFSNQETKIPCFCQTMPYYPTSTHPNPNPSCDIFCSSILLHCFGWHVKHVPYPLLLLISHTNISKALSVFFAFPLAAWSQFVEAGVGHYRPFFLNMGRHLGQYHLPLGLWLRSMHPKWNHSMGQSWLSHPIISP